MDEFDAPRKIPAENCDRAPKLEELQRQASQLFQEFLLLDDPVCSVLDQPLPASYSDLKEESDSPIRLFSAQSFPAKSRGLVHYSGSLDDDVVPDSIGFPQQIEAPVSLASTAPVEQEEKAESEKDDKLKMLAIELARAGDALVTQHGRTVQDAEGKLVQLVKQEAANLTYERFSSAIDGLVGEDKNWTNFVFAFCVGRRVCKHSSEVFDYAKSHFFQYVESYSENILEAGDIETFVRYGGHQMPQ